MFDADAVRREFPILDQQVHGKPLVYLDNANTTQKPLSVIETLDHYYRADNANIHRATHQLSERATKAYEGARERIARFFNARETAEIVFTRGCTEAINLVAYSFARPRLTPGDEILVTRMEHHSNIVPWQLVAQQTGAVLRVVPMDEHGVLDMAEFARLLGPRTALVSVIHVSNALGTVNPVREVIRLAKAQGVPVLLDGAQAAPHMPVDVQELDCDFYACSAHKMYGPTGIGALYGKRALLESMPPWMGGGDMIASVTFEHTEYNEVPYKFEAGTPNIAGVIGFGAAVDFLSRFDLREVAAHEHELLTHATAALGAVDGIRLVGQAPERAGVVSFLVGDVHPHDVGTFLDQDGVAVRTGQHCAQPVMDFYGITSTVRASFGLYNTHADVDALVASVRRVQQFFA
ncbi:cysteine desulfurase [Luteitalea sp.]|uniref:cysteine desulfurase n=1 Tax=Luteitalea sp. TaxID=2004800 RepID=UPI000AEFF97C|nr:cysteine desulfurase [Luteitalea sp.]